MWMGGGVLDYLFMMNNNSNVEWLFFNNKNIHVAVQLSIVCNLPYTCALSVYLL